MTSYPVANNDSERVDFLKSLSILDSAPDRNFDRINALTQTIFEVPIAAVTLLDNDRQWFKCVIGIDADQQHRDVAICNYTIMQDDIFEVTDLSLHPQLRDNPLVHGEPFLRYYAGTPLVVSGFKLGSLCILDFVPRPALDERKRTILKELAALVVREITVQSIMKESLALMSSRNGPELPP